jgi:hypothetical protein
MMAGEVGILNVGAGDTKLSFDPKNKGEVKRASRIVKDMINRGFAILIEVGRDDKGPLYRRALDFDPATAEYIIAGDPPEVGPKDLEIAHVKKPASAPPRSRAGKATTRVPASSTNAVAVSRTAGG